jgi:hypothetical protein
VNVSDEQPIVMHVEVTKGYFDLSRAERREFLRRLLNGLSPNSEVRESTLDPSGASNENTDGSGFENADVG